MATAVDVVLHRHLHLLAAAEHPVRRRSKDTLNKIYGAKDHPELLDWLRGWPLVVEWDDIILVHWIAAPAGVDLHQATRDIAAGFEKHIAGFLQ